MWQEADDNIDIESLHKSGDIKPDDKPKIDATKIKFVFYCNNEIKDKFLKVINSWHEFDKRTPLIKESGFHLGAIKDIVSYVMNRTAGKFDVEKNMIGIFVKLNQRCNKCGGRGHKGVLRSNSGHVKPVLCKCFSYGFTVIDNNPVSTDIATAGDDFTAVVDGSTGLKPIDEVKENDI